LATKNNENWILKGDVNSAFFHASANGRRRKIRICSLETNTDLITSQEEIKVHVVEFYNNCLEAQLRMSHLENGFWSPKECIEALERDTLQSPFSKKDVKMVIDGMKTNSAPMPNGFIVTFFQKILDTY
jgi:hypothetical protein